MFCFTCNHYLFTGVLLYTTLLKYKKYSNAPVNYCIKCKLQQLLTVQYTALNTLKCNHLTSLGLTL